MERFVGTGEHCVKVRRRFYTDSTCRAFISPHAQMTYFMQNKSEWFNNLTKHCTSVEVPDKVSLSPSECTGSIQSYMVEGSVVVVNKVIEELESLTKVFCVQVGKLILPTEEVKLRQHKWIEFKEKCEAIHNVCIDIAISPCDGPPISTNKQYEESMSTITCTVCGCSIVEVTKVKGELQLTLEQGYSDPLLATLPSVATVSPKDLHSENTQCTMLLKPHYIPLFLSKKYLGTLSEVEKIHGVQIVHVSPHAMDSVVMQVVFKTRTNHLITIQLCYCNLMYEDVDAIVNCSRQLPVEMQNVGGPTLQLELDRYIASDQLLTAASVSTILGSGNLQCKRVIHVISCLSESEHDTEDVSNISVITEALQCAQKHKLETIGFPSCNADASSAEDIIHDIQDFFVQNPDSSVHMLRIVCSSDKLINAYSGIKEFNCEEDIIDLSKLESLKRTSTCSLTKEWYWQADDGEFVMYSKVLSSRLSVKHKRTPKGSCYFQIGSNLYIVNFERMEQTNTTTGFVRRMKVVCENKKKPLSTQGNKSISMGVKWFYGSDGRETTPYSAADSNMIEQHYFGSSKSATLTQGSRRFKVDFQTMTQQALHPLLPSETNSILHIERKVCVYHQKEDALSSPKWYYMGDAKEFVPYSNHESTSIERMYQSKTVSTLSIQSRVYTFDFSEMKQINTATAYKRNIKRELSTIKDECNAIEMVPQHYICRGIVIAIKGSKENVRNARAELESKLTSQLSTRELPLPSSVSNSLQSQRRIMSVVKKYNIVSSQMTLTGSGGATNAESEPLKLTGEDTLIKVAIKAIMEEIALIASGNQGNTASSHEIPPEWQHQTKNTELFELPKSGDEFSHIDSMFRLTMPTAVILSIKRIQNNWLWERYVITRRRISKKNNGRVNEKELFHGSRSSRASMIYDSEEGFDMRYSSTGMWGQANYFAEKASYSNSYAHELGNGTREMLLAKVLTGDSYKCPSDRTLRMPPVKAGLDTHFQRERYDTVEGETNDSKVYMTYSNDKAYPAYLIVYTPDPTTYGGHSLHHNVAAQASTSSTSWSYNLSPNTSSSAQSKNTSHHGVASVVTSPSATPSSQKYPPRPQYPRSTSYQSPPSSHQPSSDQKTCILQ